MDLIIYICCREIYVIKPADSLQVNREQAKFRFQALGSRQVVASFDGGQLSSDGGVLLLRDQDRSMGLTRSLTACYTDRRDPECIGHSVRTFVVQCLLALALGYEDLNDHYVLRHDPLLSAAADKREGEALASAPTSQPHEPLRRMPPQGASGCGQRGVPLVALRCASLRRGRREVMIDLDMIDDPCTASRKAGSSTATKRATATCRCMRLLETRSCGRVRTANRDGTVEALGKTVVVVRRCSPRADRVPGRQRFWPRRHPVVVRGKPGALRGGPGAQRPVADELASTMGRAGEKACLCGGAARVYHDFTTARKTPGAAGGG